MIGPLRSSFLRRCPGFATAAALFFTSASCRSAAIEVRAPDQEAASTTAAASSDQPSPSAIAERDARLTARERVERISRDLERIRGLTFKEEVRVEVQSAAEFRKYVQEMLDKELPPDLAARQSRALQAMGLLPDGYDLRKGLADLYVSQAGAYYNPDTRTFYILMAGLPDEQMDTIILHELDHALADQYHDLKRMRERVLENPSEDARSAMAFVLEGEATYVMVKYQLKGNGQDLDQLPPQGQDFVLRTMRDLNRSMLVAASQASRPRGPGSEDIRKAMDALKDMPAFLFWGLYDPYFKGQYAVFRVQSEQGWKGVSALFEQLPDSTEQLLHPEKLTAPRDVPTPVTLPDLLPALGEGWTTVYSNTLGEAGMLALFEDALGGKKVEAASGWDGDLFALYEGPNGQRCFGWWTVWDDEAEAAGFQAALENLKDGFIAGREKGSVRKIVRTGNRVDLLVGPEALVPRILEASMAPPAP